MKTFRDKVAVITGAGSGMGRYLAILLAKDGADVSVCDVISLNEGEKIVVGDAVVLSDESKWDPNNKPVVETIPAGVAPAAPQDAPAAPKADDDPFGLGGDDAPEPEEPKADDDPFGL